MKESYLNPINKPLFGYFKTLIWSFFSISCYRDVYLRWRGYGFIYLFIFLSIIMIIPAIWLINSFRESYTHQFREHVQEMPIFSVYNGHLIMFPPTMPYLVKNKQQQVIGIINTRDVFSTNEINLLKEQYPHLFVFLQDKKIFLLFSDKAIPIKLQAFSNQMFWGKYWVNSREANIRELVYVSFIYPLLVSFVFGIMIILGIILATLEKVVALIFYRFRIKIKPLLRITYVTLTPAMIVMLVMFLVHPMAAISWFVMMYLVYINIVLWVLRKESRRLVRG